MPSLTPYFATRHGMQADGTVPACRYILASTDMHIQRCYDELQELRASSQDKQFIEETLSTKVRRGLGKSKYANPLVAAQHKWTDVLTGTLVTLFALACTDAHTDTHLHLTNVLELRRLRILLHVVFCQPCRVESSNV